MTVNTNLITATMDAEIGRLQEQIKALQKKVLAVDDLKDFRQLIINRLYETEEEMSEAANEIVKYADAPTSKEFTDAVRLHREQASEIDYFRSLGDRIEAVLAAYETGA